MGTPLGVFSRGKGWEMTVVTCFSPCQVSHMGFLSESLSEGGCCDLFPPDLLMEVMRKHSDTPGGLQTMLRVTGKGSCGGGSSEPCQSTAYLASTFLCWTLRPRSDLTA